MLLLPDGRSLAVLPTCDGDVMSWLSCKNGEFILNTGTFGKGSVSGAMSICSWAVAESGWQAAKKVWELCFADEKIGNNILPLAQKHYPEMYKYLGWCSWEEFKKDIDQDKLTGLIAEMEKSKVPVRYVLIDDGYLTEENDQLIGVEPDAEKFPDGWQAIMNSRKTDKIKWMGLWLNFNGYWNGIHPDNNLDIAPHLEKLSFNKIWTVDEELDGLMPGAAPEAPEMFYRKVVGYAKESGFSFVKVDNQARNIRLYANTDYPVSRSLNTALALEKVCDESGMGLSNCMAHNSIRTFSTRSCSVTRCSEDYEMGVPVVAKQHLYNSYSNMLWLGHTVWGDHDMFHSSDPVSGKMMAVSKAMSGAPVYLSDPPADFISEFISPLCFEDGELLRPLAPAVSLEDSIFINPFNDNKPYRVAAPLPRSAAAVVVYNLTNPETEVTGVVRFDDLTSALSLYNPDVQNDFDEGIIAYDWYAQTAIKLMPGEVHEFSMPEFSDRLFILLPIIDGISVIGDPEKYLSPCAIASVDGDNITMKNSAKCLIWKQGELSTI